MPQAVQFHRIRKQAQLPMDKSVPGVLKWEKNRLASVGSTYFEKENRKQKKEFLFVLFYNKANNWILNI